MAKKGATSINIKVVANAGSGGGGKAQQHNLRALGLGREQVGVKVKTEIGEKKQMESHHVLEDLMKKHFGDKDMLHLSPEERRDANKKFTDELNAEMVKRGLLNKSDDPDDKIVMSHVDPKLTPKNEFLIIHPLEGYLENTLKPLVKEKTKQKMQDICTPFKEGVIVIKPDTTIEDLLKFGDVVSKELNWKPVQIYIHHDEGHTDEHSQEWMENHHAHIVFDTINHENGRTVQLNRLQLANMQTMLAETLQMERGENSSDLVHLNSLEYKAQMEQANMRLNLSLSVQNVGQNPRQMMVDVINQTIEKTMERKGEYKPNDRPTLNLLREVGKDLNTNPTARCAAAIFAEIQRQPEKADEIAKIIGASTKNGKDTKDDDELMKGIKVKLDDTATFCGKTESAKMFRPLLNSAKELNLDLTPVMLEPIRNAIPYIMSQPIDRDNNNMLWCATARCKVDPMKMLQEALDNGVNSLKEMANNAIKEKDNAIAEKEVIEKDIVSLNETKTNVSEEIGKKQSELSDVKVEIAAATYEINELNSILADTADSANAVKKDLIDIATFGGINVEDNADTDTIIKSAQSAVQSTEADLKKNIESSLTIVGSSKADALKDEIHNAIEVVKGSPDTIQLEDIFQLASLADKIDIKPSDVIANTIINKFDTYSEKNKAIVCGNFQLPTNVSKADASIILKSMSANLDENKTFSQENSFLTNFKVPYGYKYLSDAVLNKVDELAESATKDPKAEEQLTTVAQFFHIDLLTATKKAVDRGEESIKKKMDKAVEAQNAEIKSSGEILKAQSAQISRNQTTIDEQDVRISQQKEKVSDLESSIAGLEKKEMKLNETLDEKANPSSIFGMVMSRLNDVVDKSLDALDKVIPNIVGNLSRDDAKQLNIDLIAENAKLQKKLETLKDDMNAVKIEARRVGITEGMKKTAVAATNEVSQMERNAVLEKSLKNANDKVEELTKQNESKDKSISSVKDENSSLRKIIDAMMPTQPKAIQLLNKMRGFSLKNIFDAIKDKVIKCFTGEITHPEYPNDPFLVKKKDIVIDTDRDEPLIDNRDLKVLAQEQHDINQKIQSKGHGL